MELLIIVIAVILVIILWPYVKVFFKRISLAAKITGCCRKNNYKLIKTHIFWFLGGKNGSKCDFYIETPNNVYSVKLWETLDKMSKLYFTKDGKYYFKSYGMWLLFGGHFVGGSSSRPQRLKRYDFRVNFRDEWYIKGFTPVLLINPVCADILREISDSSGNARTVPVGWGETVNGASVYKLTRFIGELEVRK